MSAIKSRPLSEILRPLTDAERKDFEEFKRQMREEVVPRIVEKVKSRRRLAALSRGFYFDSATEREMHNAWRKRAEEAEAKIQEIADGEEPDAIRKARQYLGLEVGAALPAPEPPQPPWLGGSALSPEAYAETLRAIESRAAFYHGQPGADVDWLLGIVRGIRLRGAALPAEHAPPDRDRIELMAARAGSLDATRWCSVHDAPRSRFECARCFNELAALALGSRPALAGSLDEQMAAKIAALEARNDARDKSNEKGAKP